MKKYIYFAIGIAAMLMATSCEKDVFSNSSSGKGGFSLALNLSDKVNTRTLTDEQETNLINASKVKIYKPNFDGLIREYTFSAMPNEVYLPAGNGYRVDVVAGEAAAASPRKANFEAKSYKGSANFNIVANQITEDVAVTAKISNAITNVAFDKTISDNFTSGTLTFSLADGETVAANTLAYSIPAASETVTEPTYKEGYFIIDDIIEETSLYWTFSGTKTDSSSFTAKGSIAASTDSDDDKNNDLVGTRHTMLFKYILKDGTLTFDLEVNTGTDEIPDNITWAPTSTGLQPIDTSDIWATFVTARADVDTDTYNGDKVYFQYRVKPTTETAWSDFSESGTDCVKATAVAGEEGVYEAQITGLDPNKDYEVRLRVFTKDVTEGETTTPGALDTELVNEQEFKTAVAMQIPNASFEEVGTNDYNLTAFYTSAETKWWDCGNQKTLGISVEPTTSVEDIPDSSIDGYYNIGANTRSVKMQSGTSGLGTITVFGAGNLYSGQYGTTKTSPPSGTVYFGCPWKNDDEKTGSRPTALKLYVKYNSGTFTNNYTAVKGMDEIIGDNDTAYDQAQIKVAIGTWGKDKKTANKYGGNMTNPILVDTADKDKIINYESDGIKVYNYGYDITYGGATIAYGTAIIDGEKKTNGQDVYINGTKSSKDYTNWGVITIPLVYYDLSTLPTHIVIAFASSRFGDYFAGSTASCLQIDGLQLIYDYDNFVEYTPPATE